MVTKRARPLRGLEVEHLLELPGIHARRAEVERLAGFDDIVQRLAGLFDGRVLVEAMDLVEVDVIDAEALEAGVDGGHDVLAREAAVVGRVAHGVEDLGGNHQLFAAGLELAQQLAGDALALAERVDVGGIEEVDAGFDGAADEGLAPLLLRAPTRASSWRRRSSCRDRVGRYARRCDPG